MTKNEAIQHIDKYYTDGLYYYKPNHLILEEDKYILRCDKLSLGNGLIYNGSEFKFEYNDNMKEILSQEYETVLSKIISSKDKIKNYINAEPSLARIKSKGYDDYTYGKTKSLKKEDVYAMCDSFNSSYLLDDINKAKTEKRNVIRYSCHKKKNDNSWMIIYKYDYSKTFIDEDGVLKLAVESYDLSLHSHTNYRGEVPIKHNVTKYGFEPYNKWVDNSEMMVVNNMYSIVINEAEYETIKKAILNIENIIK